MTDSDMPAYYTYKTIVAFGIQRAPPLLAFGRYALSARWVLDALAKSMLSVEAKTSSRNTIFL